MSDFDSVVSAAQPLPDDDRLRLLDALCDSVPVQVLASLPPETSKRDSVEHRGLRAAEQHERMNVPTCARMCAPWAESHTSIVRESVL